ncbi:MAG: zinc ribbon-containing protein [Gammaproteobacteria bacterium]|nr:zinc ribbon-containing protein [Gammaproteobacteria bacterium]
MSSENRDDGLSQRLISGYHHLLLNLHRLYQRDGAEQQPGIYQNIDSLSEQLSEIVELTREEQQRISDYLKRDLEDAAQFLIEGGQELKEWLRFDIALIEEGLAEAFSNSVDQTRIELEQLKQEVARGGQWQSGEICGVGTLQCSSCGRVVSFRQPGTIPICPECGGKLYQRLPEEA